MLEKINLECSGDMNGRYMVFEAEEKLNLLDLFGERKYMNNGFKLWTLILFIQFLPVCMWLSRLLCLLTFCLMLFSLSESFFSRA